MSTQYKYTCEVVYNNDIHLAYRVNKRDYIIIYDEPSDGWAITEEAYGEHKGKFGWWVMNVEEVAEELTIGGE